MATEESPLLTHIDRRIRRPTVDYSSVWSHFREEDRMRVWLEQLNMGQYCQNFIDCGATMNILMSINENELKNVLGVKCLHDRRILNDALFILKQSKDKTVCGHVPEHTQMLNFLMNTRLLFSWILFVIQVETFAVALLFLTAEYHSPELKICAVLIAGLGPILLLYSGSQYFKINRLSNDIRTNQTLGEDVPQIGPRIVGGLMFGLACVIILYGHPLKEDNGRKISENTRRDALFSTFLSTIM